MHGTSADPAKRAAGTGFGLVEVLVALTVLGLGVLSTAGIGLAARRQAELASATTMQVVAARTTLERLHAGREELVSGVETVVVGSSSLKVWRDVEWIGPQLAEIRVRVDARLPAPALEVRSRLYRPYGSAP